jgi:hypothetical protein
LTALKPTRTPVKLPGPNRDDAAQIAESDSSARENLADGGDQRGGVAAPLEFRLPKDFKVSPGQAAKRH